MKFNPNPDATDPLVIDGLSMKNYEKSISFERYKNNIRVKIRQKRPVFREVAVYLNPQHIDNIRRWLDG